MCRHSFTLLILSTYRHWLTLRALLVGRSGSLIFLNIAPNDSGNYTCEAVNEKLNVGETGSLYEVNVTPRGQMCDIML